jgi:hypothetical protein
MYTPKGKNPDLRYSFAGRPRKKTPYAGYLRPEDNILCISG